jgi:hypothetical protein
VDEDDGDEGILDSCLTFSELDIDGSGRDSEDFCLFAFGELLEGDGDDEEEPDGGEADPTEFCVVSEL